MSHGSKPTLDLERLIDALAVRYEYDTRERIVASRTDGVVPRFVLMRAREGCAWRFCVGLPDEIIVEAARLAGRERGLGSMPPGEAPPPERLEMIRRRVEATGEPVALECQLIEREGRLVGEIWLLR